MTFCVSIIGATLPDCRAAVERLAGCSLRFASQPELQLGEHLCAYHDATSDTLWVAVAAAAADSGGSDEAPSWEGLKAAEARTQHAALLAFLSSHAVLWLQPPQAAQAAAAQPLPHATQLLSQLRLLQQLKSALLPAALRLLELSPEEASAVTPGLCVPQLLVLAQVQQPAAAPVEATGAAGAAIAAETAAPPAEQLAAAAEAAERQLRLLLKLCRPLQPEGSARALCSLPTAGPLVLALPEHLGSGGSQEQLVADALADLGLAGQQAPPAKPLPAATVAAALAQQRSAVAAMAAGAASPPSVQGWLHAVRGLSAVLKAAALRAAGSGSAADVEVPPEASAAVAWQEACSDGVQQFSQASCKRAAALAAEAYRRNTPALLPAAGHAAALQAALRLYRSLARGPAAAGGAAALQQQLSDYWRDGHQQCEAVSFLGNPCCLPAHDPQQQPHTSSNDAARPLLLLASGSGAQQHRIPEPFTVAELQAAAAAVAGEGPKAAARSQFHVRRLGEGGAAAPGGPAGAAANADGPAAEAAEDLLLEDEETAAGARRQLSGGHSSDEEATVPAAALPADEDGAAASAAQAAVAAARAAAGTPAAGCWLEMHVLGRRSEWRSAALSAALLMDGQPGWLRAGGCLLATLPLLVAVPGKPGQQATAAAEQQQGGGPQAEEFPSLAEVKQQEQQRRRPLAAKRAPAKKKGGETAAAQEPAQQQGPLLLGFPGWQPPAAALAAAGLGGDAAQLAAASAAGGRPQQRGKQQGQQRGKPQPSQQQQQAPPAGTEQANILLGAEYESVQGQRLLLTPVLLAAALQSSLDSVAVRQQAPTAAAVGPGPRTAVAAAAAAQASPGSAAAFLLHQDLPLWLQLPGEQLAQLAGGKRRSGPGGAAGGGAAERPVWLQLRRLLVATPEAAVPFEAAPKLLVEVPRDMLAPPVAPAMPSDTGAGSGPAGRASQAGATAPGTVQLQYSLAAPLALPQGSFCCIALPWLLTAPTLGASGGVSLIRQSGPIRAAVAAHTVVRPQQEAAAA